MKPPIIHLSLSVCWHSAHPAHHHLGGGELSASGQRYFGDVEPGQLLLVLNLFQLIMVLADGTLAHL